MWIALIVIVVIVVGLVLFVISGFNKLRTTDIGAQVLKQNKSLCRIYLVDARHVDTKRCE